MRNLLLAVAVAALCGGCAHSELTAPCASNKFASLNDVPCDNRQPVNLAALDLAWFDNEE